MSAFILFFDNLSPFRVHWSLILTINDNENVVIGDSLGPIIRS